MANKQYNMGRRDFLGMVGLTIMGAMTFFGVGKMLFPRVSFYPSKKFKIGKVSIPEGETQILKERQIALMKTTEGLAAISLTCTHLGCIVNRIEEGFVCPCHGSRFAPDGNVTQGPAPSSLKWFKISKAPDGALVVNANQTVPQGTYFTG